MKIDRQSHTLMKLAVKLAVMVSFIGIWHVNAFADPPSVLAKNAELGKKSSSPSSTKAFDILHKAKLQLANEDAFNAKIRQRVWTGGRLVVGVGTYEQAGNETGRFNLQVSMHDGGGKHTLQQVSDGRLSWTQSIIGEAKTLKRVDVGRLDEWVRASRKANDFAPRLEVGAFTEMLTNIQRDYTLTAQFGKLQDAKVLIVKGKLKDEVRQQIISNTERSNLAELYPSNVRVAITLENDANTQFGKWLPIRFEFRGDPQKAKNVNSNAASTQGPLISLLEIYSIHPIEPPPVDRFRFDSQEVINFTNETDRYLRNYGIRLTDRQRRQLLR